MLPRTVRWDEPDTLILARNLLRGDGYHVFAQPELIWPPGMPLLAAVPMAFGVPGEYALPLWHVVSGALIVGLLVGLVNDVTGNPRLALLVGALAAVFPPLSVAPLYWGSLSEIPFLCLLLLGLWAGWRVLARGSKWGGLVAGLAFGAGYLIRTEGIAWWGLLCLALIVVSFKGRPSWRSLALTVAGFAACALPYVLYLREHTGQWQLTGKAGISLVLTAPVLIHGGAGQDIAASLDSTGREILWLSREPSAYTWSDLFREYPGGMLGLIRSNIAEAASALAGPMLGVAGLALAVVGVIGRMYEQVGWADLFWLSALAPLGILFVSKVEPRYLLPGSAIALVWAARGLLYLGGWAEAWANRLRVFPDSELWRRARGVAAAAALALLFTGYLVSGVRVTATGQAGMFPSHEAAGYWLQAHTAPEDKVMSRNSELAFYADRPLVAFPDASWEQVLAYARARDAAYLVTDDYELKRLRPQLAFLMDPATAPAGVEIVERFEGPLRTTWIYRIRN